MASNGGRGHEGQAILHWKKIRTTNGLERINKELKRRSRVVGASPNDASLLRLGGAILIDVNE